MLIYLGTQGSGMAERSATQAKAAQAQFDEYEQEFDSIKQKALA